MLISSHIFIRAGPIIEPEPDKICSKMKNVTLQSSTASAVTSQPLPFDRMEREKHIQMIFRAFKNRCGPTCECRSSSSQLCNTLDWKADDLRSLATVRGTKNPLSPVSSRTEVEDLHSRFAGTLCFISVLETVEKIHITARSGLQGESEELLSFNGRICPCVTEGCCHCRPTVCPQEDLQHHHRRQQLTVSCRRRRYWSSPQPGQNIKLSQSPELFYSPSPVRVRDIVCVPPVLRPGPRLLPAGLWLPGSPGLLLWEAPGGGRLLLRLLPDGDEGLRTAWRSHWLCAPEVRQIHSNALYK